MKLCCPLSIFKITTRLYLLIAVIVFGMIGAFSLCLQIVSTSMYDHHYENTQKLVEAAQAIVASFGEDVEKNLLSKEEAQKIALKKLEAMSFNEKSYFWVYTSNGDMLFHPTMPQLEGTNVYNMQDAQGVYLVQEMLKIIDEKKKGRFSYYWPPDPKIAKKKSSYIMYYKCWDWIIGRGDYIEDIENHTKNIGEQLALLLGAITIAAVFLSFVIGRSISTPLLSLNRDMQKLAAGNLDISVKEQERLDEIGDMARTVKIFQQHTQSILKLDAERAENERMKNEFISVVSHELRTPLTSIRGALGLLATTLLKDLPEKTQKSVQIAYKNSERLALLINDILDIDKIVSEQMKFDMREESLGNLLSQAVDLNRAYAEDFCVRYNYIELKPDPLIFIDASRFLQVMSNLMSNAAKFSPGGGHVDIFSKNMGDYAHITVRDYGLGIPENFRNKIFKKFSQADSSATRQKGGTGLGLFISKLLIEQMGGHIGYTTQTGLGTSFWLEIPIYRLNETPSPPVVKDNNNDKENAEPQGNIL